MSRRRSFVVFTLEHSLLLPAGAIVALVWANLARTSWDPGPFVAAPATAHDALSVFKHRMKLPVQAVLFLFGLVNAGVQLRAVGLDQTTSARCSA
jgi:hypothetical protein